MVGWCKRTGWAGRACQPCGDKRGTRRGAGGGAAGACGGLGLACAVFQLQGRREVLGAAVFAGRGVLPSGGLVGLNSVHDSSLTSCFLCHQEPSPLRGDRGGDSDHQEPLQGGQHPGRGPWAPRRLHADKGPLPG